MKKILLGLLILSFVSCASISIKPTESYLTQIQKTGTAAIGYYIAKNNIVHIPEILAWYEVFKKREALLDVKAEYKKGIKKLTEMISDDIFIQGQIEELINSLGIMVEGPEIPGEIQKYQEVVKHFMLGVSSVRLL